MLNELKVDGIIASDGGVIDVIKKKSTRYRHTYKYTSKYG